MENDPSSDQPNDNSKPAADTGGTAAGDQGSELRQTIQAGSDSAVAEHIAEASQPKRGRGRPIIHGRYSSKFPVENVGAGTVATPGPENQPVVHPLGWQPPVAPFNEKAASAAVDLAIKGLEFLGGIVVRLIGRKEVGDPEVIQKAVDNSKVPDEAREHLRAGSVELLRIHAVDLTHLPYGQIGLGLIMWGGAVGDQVSTLKDQGKLLREGK